MTRAAIAASAKSVAGELPADVSARVRWTAEVDAVPQDTFGVAVRRAPDELVIALIAGSPRSARMVADMARAFIGPSHAFNRRPQTVLQAGDPFADEVWALAGDNGVQVLAAPPSSAMGCLTALARLVEVHERMPRTAVVAVRPLAPILRDFEGAVARGDIATAQTLRDEAWATGRLTLVNRSFLDARVIAAAGDPDSVLAHARRFRMADLPLPAPVEHDLIRALGVAFLVPIADDGPDALVAAFHDRIAPEFGAAFGDHRIAASPEARLAWVVHYLSLEAVPLAALREVLDQARDDERSALDSLVDVDQPPAKTARVRALQAGGEHAAAFAVALDDEDLEPEVREETLTRSAASLDDPVRQAQAAEAVARKRPSPEAASPGTVVDLVFARVSDWGSWLEALFEHPDADDARKVLDAGSERWTEALRTSDDDLATWSEHIEALAGEATFRAAIPRLAQAILPQGPESTALAVRRVPVMLALTYAIAEDDAPGTGGLDALGDLAESMLPTGLGAGDYELVVDRCEHVFRLLSAPPRLARWIVDMVRTVMYEPAPSDDARADAASRLVGTLMPDAGRARPLIKAEAWLELAELLKEHPGLREALSVFHIAAEAQASDEPFAELKGRTVLLHSLVESAGDRAKAYLQDQGAERVWVDSSHVGSDRLRDIASRADIVVVAAKAAKHAAYETIRSAAGDRLRYASGKGWSSLVTAVGEALQTP